MIVTWKLIFFSLHHWLVISSFYLVAIYLFIFPPTTVSSNKLLCHYFSYFMATRKRDLSELINSIFTTCPFSHYIRWVVVPLPFNEMSSRLWAILSADDFHFFFQRHVCKLLTNYCQSARLGVHRKITRRFF